MKPPKVIKGQRVASTNLDLHGEKFSKAALEIYAKGNTRIPLHQHHDMSKETVGYVENFRVEPDSNNAGEWVLNADVYYLVDNIDETAFGGFSISVPEICAGNQENAEGQIFLPFPFYNDAALVSSLSAEFPDYAIGKWRKKGKGDGSLAVALIINLAGIILKPVWDDLYKQTIRPHLLRLLKISSQLNKKNISVEFGQGLFGPKGESVGAYFIPIRNGESHCLGEEKIFEGIKEAHRFLFSDKKSRSVGTKTVRLLFDGKSDSFKIIHVEYADGSDVNIIV